MIERKKYPKISLVTACYNHRDYIAETIESVLAQNYPNLQYVVIDDGSNDGSWEIIQKYKDSLFHCERLENYRDTVAIALNYGFSKTDGEIMGWLNSDDVLLPGSLFTLAKIFDDNPDVEWFTGMASTINYESKLVNSKFRLKNKHDYLIGDWKTIQQESTFWRHNLWDRVNSKLNEEKKWAFDTELWTRFFLLTEHYHANVPLGAFRKGAQSKSIQETRRNKKKAMRRYEIHIEKMKKEAGFKLIFYSSIYLICKKVFWPFLSLLPNRLIAKMPLLKNYTYKVLVYSFDYDKWQKRILNPFRKCYI